MGSSLLASSPNRLFANADVTVGDVAVVFTVTCNEVLIGKNISFIFIKPSGATRIVTAEVVGTFTASWGTSLATDLDEEGRWYIAARNDTSGYYYTKEENFTFVCRRKPGGES